MDKLVDSIGGIKTGRSYQFYCISCELNMILYEGIKKSSKISSVNYFCFNCNKISYHNQCLDCGEKLYYIVKIPEEKDKINQGEEKPLEIKLKCPRCESTETLLVLMGEWG